MVKEVLVDEMISAGKDLLTELESASLHPKAVLWLYSSETNLWEYVIAMPAYDLEGPLKSFEKVQSVLEKNKTLRDMIPLRSINVISPSDDLIRSLRKKYRSGADKKVYRIKSTNVDGEFVEDAYIYKLL